MFKRHIYLDYASATPVSRRTMRAMERWWSKEFYNPSALYPRAREVRLAQDEARRIVAEVLHGRPEEIIFLSGGTESINLAIGGTVRRAKKSGIEMPEVIACEIEHAAVRETLYALEKNKEITVHWIRPAADGLIDPKSVLEKLNSCTALVTIGYANNEIGVVQPIAQIGEALLKWKREQESIWPLYHSDACQAANYLSLNRDHLRVDLLSLDGAKIYGPKGAGILYIKSGVHIEPLLYGGGQEKALRPGTEAMPLIIGFAEALRETAQLRKRETLRLSALRQYFVARLTREFPQARVSEGSGEQLPHLIHFCIEGLQAEFATIALGEQGIMVSPQSACGNLDREEGSAVMKVLGKSECKTSSLRISMGRGTKKGHLDRFFAALPRVLSLCMMQR